MNKAIHLTVLLCALAILCAGCPGDKSGSSKEFEKKRAEALKEKDLADFFLQEQYYPAARKHYKETVNTAYFALSYRGGDKEMTRLIEKAKGKLNSKEIIEGCQGKITIGEKWEKPEDYLAKRVKEICASPDYEKTSAALKEEFKSLLKEVGNTPARAPETDSGKKIIATGMKALPVLLEQINTGEYRYDKIAATHLILNIPERKDTILCFLLVCLKKRDAYVRKACASLAPNFPRKATTVALVEALSDCPPKVLGAYIKSIIKLKEPLGWYMLSEKMNEPRASLKLKEQILANLYLYGNDQAVDALIRATQLDKPPLVMAATRSLLEMDSEKVPLALSAVLKRVDESNFRDEELLIAVIEKIGKAKYAEAVDALAAIFYNRAFPMAIREAAIDALVEIGNRASVEHLSLMVHEQEEEHSTLWMKVADAIKRLKSREILDKFIKDTKSSSPEVVTRAAYVLGLCEEEIALVPLRKAFHRVKNKKTHSAILNALARIGSKAAIDEILLIFKTGNIHEILNNYVDGIQKNIRHGSSFYVLFKGLEDCPARVRKRVFDTVKADAPPLALEALLQIALEPRLPLEVRFGAIGALPPYTGQMGKMQKDAILSSITNSMNLLKHERDPDLFVKLAFEALRDYEDPRLLPLLVNHLENSDNWLMRYLAARCLSAIIYKIPSTIALPYRRKLAGIYRECLNNKDYNIAEFLVLFTKNRDEERAGIDKMRSEEIAKISDPNNHPLKDRLGQPLPKLLELLGKNYTEISPTQPTPEDGQAPQKFNFLHFTDDAILLMVSKGPHESEKNVTAAAYLPDFKGKLYGVSIGDNINAVLRIVQPENREYIRYLPEYTAYLVTFELPSQGEQKQTLIKMLTFALEETDEGKATIKFMAEILSQKGKEEDLDALARVITKFTAK